MKEFRKKKAVSFLLNSFSIEMIYSAFLHEEVTLHFVEPSGQVVLILLPVPPGLPEVQQSHLEMSHAAGDPAALGWRSIPSYAAQLLLQKLLTDKGGNSSTTALAFLVSTKIPSFKQNWILQLPFNSVSQFI